jgi:uncharacterized lipoprotein YehR (DUF1307 family)
MKKQLLKKSSVLVIACICWLGLTGCGQNKANMESGSSMVVTDSEGNKYLVEHDLLEVYRVKILPNYE